MGYKHLISYLPVKHLVSNEGTVPARRTNRPMVTEQISKSALIRQSKKSVLAVKSDHNNEVFSFGLNED